MVLQSQEKRPTTSTGCTSKLRVLFISHSAGLTGAPIILLHFLRWLKANTDLKFSILLREGGKLEDAFAELAPTWLWDGRRVGCCFEFWQKLRRRVGRSGDRAGEKRRKRLLRRLRRSSIDLIYSNTITNGALLDWLELLNVPVLTHVHEMSHWIEACGPENLEAVKRHSVAYIAASHAVKRELDEKWNIPASKITVVHEFIPTDVDVPDNERKAEIRRSLGIPLDSFLVVGSGVETWRKGKDLFVDLAKELNRRSPERDTRLLWVGAWEHKDHEAQFRERLRSEGLEDQVKFIGQVTNPLNYFAAADAFAMTSREDPYPLVCLEAALVGLPIICFSQAGGMPEFVEDNAGQIVPFLNVSAMADCIVKWINDPLARNQFGQFSASKVRKLHDVTVSAPEILNSIKNAVALGVK